MDLYERLRRERRREQEQVARRYRIGGVFFVIALLALLALLRMSKDCGYDLFEWNEYHRCSLPEIGNWLLSDAGMSWIFWTAIIVSAAVLIARFRGSDA